MPGKDVLPRVRQRVRTTWQGLSHLQRDRGPAAAGPYRVGLRIWMDARSFETN